jgi:hypothetical protein
VAAGLVIVSLIATAGSFHRASIIAQIFMHNPT